MPETYRTQRGKARTQRPERNQVEMQLLSLDQLIDAEHRVRVIWQYVESLDLSELYRPIKATVDNVGRNPVDPQILFALWLFATIEGLSSARKLDELTKRDLPYMWICGGVSVNYHLLSDFRVDHGDLLDRILTDSITVLLRNDLITLETIGQDGMRVRASAGSGSFRTQDGLKKAHQVAKEHVDRLKENDQDPGENERRRVAAQKRAAREKLERIEAAQLEMEDMQEKYKKRGGGKAQRSEPRASTTDPEARRTKMGDGGTRPAMNVQFASDGDAKMIVGVDVTSQGSDNGLMKPMYDEVVDRYSVTPKEYLVDGGFTKNDDITHLEQQGTAVLAPLYGEKKQLDAGKDPYAARASESDEMAAHRARMGTPEAKERYQRRSAIAEFPNADCRNRNLTQFRVRGLIKAKAQTLWHVLAFNLLRMRNLYCPLREKSYLEVVMGS
ncbi:transposase [Rhodopirellula sp. JC639]|uniref:transposase n=1 Tax=Stieleria mannarensis TaxID=2755585 RepID=UPI0015FF9500|nr:transposase [Rhodopirellula sp. JC639]